MAKCVYDGKGYLPECEHCIDTVGAGMVCTNDCIIELREVIAAKDEEIARLKQEVENGIEDFAKAVSGMVKRDALIREMTDALSQSVINHCYRCRYFRYKHTECKDKKNEVRCWSKLFKLLVAKAREVVGENRAKDGAEQDGEGM